MTFDCGAFCLLGVAQNVRGPLFKRPKGVNHSVKLIWSTLRGPPDNLVSGSFLALAGPHLGLVSMRGFMLDSLEHRSQGRSQVFFGPTVEGFHWIRVGFIAPWI